jgi:hypothetical protein
MKDEPLRWPDNRYSDKHLRTDPSIHYGDLKKRGETRILTYPVPVHVNSGLTVIESKISSSKLLIAEESTIFTPL